MFRTVLRSSFAEALTFANRRVTGYLLLGSLPAIAALVAAVQPGVAQRSVLPNLHPFPNASGILETFSTQGDLDLSGPFFQSLGTNGRACITCHLPDQGWTISAQGVQQRFRRTNGLDPIFRTNDGSNCDHDVDVSTREARKQAYSLLTSRGLIRIAVSVPAGAEFVVENVNNPYGCWETDVISMYRRPLPSTNLRFVSAVMWDGRESSPQTGTQRITFESENPGAILIADLAHQSVDATLGHAQALVPPTSAQQQAIVDFELGLFTAQALDRHAGVLNANGVRGGPVSLAAQQFFIGINDPIDPLNDVINRPDLGFNPNHDGFTPVIFRLFDAWSNPQHWAAAVNRARASIARGEALFNSKPINISGVSGLNDELGMSVIPGTCGTCHDAPNVGNHSFPTPLNIGVGDLTSPLDVSYLPVITLRHLTAPYEIVQTTDPSRALITGKWNDIGKVKGPILRGLASRAPYFHNGSATTLSDVIEFYDQRFGIGFSAQEKTDLVAFLSAL
jgi:cytochrome c peroxidase